MDTFLQVLEFLAKYWAGIVGAITTTVGVVSTVITAIKTKNWTKIKDSIKDYIQQAETLNADGSVKKEIVLAKVRTLCVQLKIKFNEQKISDLIESLVALTKAVNARDKDKSVAVDTTTI